jgi:hypothetical protein
LGWLPLLCWLQMQPWVLLLLLAVRQVLLAWHLLPVLVPCCCSQIVR